MAISTYANLQTAVSNWLDRSDLDDRVPEFIAICEAELNRRVRTLDMLTRDDAFTVASRYEDLPADFLGAKRIVLDRSPVVNLDYLPPEEMTAQRQRFDSSGIPIYYSVIGGSFEFLPTPNDTYTASVLYFERLTSLSDEDTTNWLLDSHPDVYLYGSLKAAEPFLRNDERLPVWASQFEAALNQLNTQDARASRGLPTMRGRSFG